VPDGGEVGDVRRQGDGLRALGLAQFRERLELLTVVGCCLVDQLQQVSPTCSGRVLPFRVKRTTSRMGFPGEENRGRLEDSLASLRSRTWDFRALISANSSLEGPGRSPPSIWAWTIHFRSVSGPTPSFGPRAWAAAQGEGYS
jgi:hypothetical protein